jgi:integrase
MSLSVKRVERLKTPGHHIDAHGLYLQVKPSGSKSWLLRWERDGRDHWMGLGPLHTYSLDEARERARAARKLIREGIDPRAKSRAERARRAADAANVVTFDRCAEEYFNAHSDGWRNAKHRAQFKSTLDRYVSPIFGSVAVADIDQATILKALTPIWGKKRETASRVRGRIEAVLNFAMAHGYRPMGENPARWTWLSNLLAPGKGKNRKEVAHHAAMPFDDVPAFMAELAQRSSVAARALEFTILTAARTGETLGARWAEIDLDAKLWTVPAERMKGGVEHRVPLSKRAAAILEAMPREGQFVFPGNRAGRPLSNMSLLAVLKRMERDGVTTHGFRSSFRDWTAERTNTPTIVAEAALAHAVRDKVEAAYRRGDLLAKRAKLMADWATFCSTPRAATVTAISARHSAKG